MARTGRHNPGFGSVDLETLCPTCVCRLTYDLQRSGARERAADGECHIVRVSRVVRAMLLRHLCETLIERAGNEVGKGTAGWSALWKIAEVRGLVCRHTSAALSADAEPRPIDMG